MKLFKAYWREIIISILFIILIYNQITISERICNISPTMTITEINMLLEQGKLLEEINTETERIDRMIGNISELFLKILQENRKSNSENFIEINKQLMLLKFSTDSINEKLKRDTKSTVTYPEPPSIKIDDNKTKLDSIEKSIKSIEMDMRFKDK